MNKDDLVSVQTDILGIADRLDLEKAEYDDLVEMGRGVNEVKTFANWVIAKLGDAVDKKYGNLIKYAKDINYNYSSLTEYISAYRKYIKEDPDFSPDKYYGRVPWALIQLVAHKSDTPVTMLNELVDNGNTSLESGYREIKKKETGKEVPKKPLVKLKWSDESGKWRIYLDEKDFDLIDWQDVKSQLNRYLSGLE